MLLSKLKELHDFFVEKVFVGAIKLYQKGISPRRNPVCRFIPSCSRYTITAIRRFGIIRGGFMGLCRIIRCNPLCKGGYDPVPAHFSIRPFKGLTDFPPEENSESGGEN